jgi:hypothetical protein
MSILLYCYEQLVVECISQVGQMIIVEGLQKIEEDLLPHNQHYLISKVCRSQLQHANLMECDTRAREELERQCALG